MPGYRYKKPYRIKKKKSILRNRFFRLGVLVLSAIVGIAYFLFFSGFFQIEKITVSGNKTVSEQSIKENLPRGNLFLTDIAKIKGDILGKFPQIAGAEIHRKFPDALSILIAERLPIALWCQADRCFLLDDTGVIFGEARQTDELFKLSGAKELFDKERISLILKIRDNLKDGVGIAAAQAFIASGERFNVKTSEGWEIYFNLKEDLDWQIAELKLVLEKQITPEKRKTLEYVDLRFSRVYYK